MFDSPMLFWTKEELISDGIPIPEDAELLYSNGIPDYSFPSNIVVYELNDKIYLGDWCDNDDYSVSEVTIEYALEEMESFEKANANIAAHEEYTRRRNVEARKLKKRLKKIKKQCRKAKS